MKPAVHIWISGWANGAEIHLRAMCGARMHDATAEQAESLLAAEATEATCIQCRVEWAIDQGELREVR